MTYEQFKPFLDTVLGKIEKLNAAELQKFTNPRLDTGYLYHKWLEKEKDFVDLYLNMDHIHQDMFATYCGITENHFQYANSLHRFFLFCCNYDSYDFRENPFAHEKNGPYLCKLATGKEKPQGIKAMQVIKAYRESHNDAWKYYMLRCALGIKKTANAK